VRLKESPRAKNKYEVEIRALTISISWFLFVLGHEWLLSGVPNSRYDNDK
jgi:hypothetical protein